MNEGRPNLTDQFKEGCDLGEDVYIQLQADTAQVLSLSSMVFFELNIWSIT